MALFRLRVGRLLPTGPAPRPVVGMASRLIRTAVMRIKAAYHVFHDIEIRLLTIDAAGFLAVHTSTSRTSACEMPRYRPRPQLDATEPFASLVLREPRRVN